MGEVGIGDIPWERMGWVDSILTHTFDVWDMPWERWDVGDIRHMVKASGNIGYIRGYSMECIG